MQLSTGLAAVAHLVPQRTREVGIRMALGADAPALIRTMVGEALQWISARLILGAGGALATGRLLGSYLFVVQPRDPAVLAALIPARAAARVDPSITLRCE